MCSHGEIGGEAPESFVTRPSVEPLGAGVPVRDHLIEVGGDDGRVHGVQKVGLQMDLPLGSRALGDVLHRAANPGAFTFVGERLDTHLRAADLPTTEIAVLEFSRPAVLKRRRGELPDPLPIVRGSIRRASSSSWLHVFSPMPRSR